MIEKTRPQFVKWLIKKMEKDPNIWLLYIDLGFGFLGEIKEKFPDRCINTGIIEQSAIGIACGLAIMGKKVFVYSIFLNINGRIERIRF